MFWLDVPLYTYTLPCGWPDEPHLFRSRTPLEPATDTILDSVGVVWCERCQDYRTVDLPTVEVSRDPGSDEPVALAQDRGILRERVGRWLLATGNVGAEDAVSKVTARFPVSDSEARRVLAGLIGPETESKQEMCGTGRHAMVGNNVMLANGSRRRCRACQNENVRTSRARKRADSTGLANLNAARENAA